MPHPIVALLAPTPADLLYPYGARIREMRAQGFQVLACTDAGPEASALEDLGAEHRRLPVGFPDDPARLAVAWLLLTSTCIERQVLLLHSLHPGLHLMAALAAKAATVPIALATTAHDLPTSPLARLAARSAASLLDAWITPFAAHHAQAAAFVPADRLHRVEADLGADVRAVHPRHPDAPSPEDARARFGLTQTARWVGVVQRLGHPDPALLLACLDRAQQADPALGWVVASCQPLPPDLLAALHKRQAQGRPVVALPERTRAEIFPLLRALDLLASPHAAAHPGAALALAEAAAAGLPAVAFAHADAADLIADAQTGALVAPGDVHAFTDTLLRIARSERRRRDLGAAARVRAEQRLDFEFGQAHLFNLYDELIKAKV